MLRKIVTGLAAVSIVLGGAAAAGSSSVLSGSVIVANAEVVTADGYQFASLDDGSYKLMGYTGSAEEFTVPASITEGTVSTIGAYAFSGNATLKSVTVEDGIKSIEGLAFNGCTVLESITIPASVTEIGEGAFEGCTALNISCYEGSAASEYAEANGINYTLIEEPGQPEQPEQPETVSIKKATVTLSKTSYKYKGGAAVKPGVTVTYDGKTLKKGTDYTVSYINNTEAGTGTVIVYGAGSYTDSTTQDFTITQLSVKNAVVKGIKKNYRYTGSKITPKITSVSVGSYTLKQNIDYTVTCKNNVKAGTATVTIKGERSYKGKYTQTFKIKKKTVAKATVKGIKKSYAYTSKAIKPVPTKVTVAGNVLKKGTDYTVSYKNNKTPGTATLTIKGKGNYFGSIKKTFTVAKKSVAKASVKGVSKRYLVTGKAIKPAVTAVKLGSVTLKKGRDYTVSYKNNVKAGTASVIIKGKGNYKGKVTKKFTILSNNSYKMWQYTIQVVKLVNKERAAKGLGELTLDETLYDRAMIRSKELLKSISHTRPDGTQWYTVFDGIKYYYLGENIAAGHTTPEQVVKAWMDSEGHRANILNTSFKKIGVGLVFKKNSEKGYYWTQLFLG